MLQPRFRKPTVAPMTDVTPPLSIRTVGTICTGVTITHRERDPNDGIFTAINGGVPIDTCTSGWTSRLLRLPVNGKIGRSNAFVFWPLSSIITTHRAAQVQLVAALGFDQQLCIDVPHVGQMHAWQQVMLL